MVETFEATLVDLYYLVLYGCGGVDFLYGVSAFISTPSHYVLLHLEF